MEISVSAVKSHCKKFFEEISSGKFTKLSLVG